MASKGCQGANAPKTKMTEEDIRAQAKGDPILEQVLDLLMGSCKVIFTYRQRLEVAKQIVSILPTAKRIKEKFLELEESVALAHEERDRANKQLADLSHEYKHVTNELERLKGAKS